MLRITLMSTWLVLSGLTALSQQHASADEILPSLHFERGPINRVWFDEGGRRVAIYSTGEDLNNVDELLLTHHRRDAVAAAARLAKRGGKLTAPKAEEALLERPHEFWQGFVTARFHDYAQQTTKVIAQPLPIARKVADGDEWTWREREFRTLATPGYTPGSVTYLTQVSGRKVAFTGDLIYGDGKILDLYSFQDAIPEANIRGYHGYGSRLASLVTSLKKLLKENPDLIIPARGPVIRNPREAIGKLITRVERLYRNYLSTNALYWYFKKERMTTCAERILGKSAEFELLPYALHEKTPDWVIEQATSRILVSDSGNAFLLDCGYDRVIEAVQKLISAGLVKKVEGIFVTHYHDDHTDRVQAAADEFACPIYAMKQYADVLTRPGAYHLPAMTDKPMTDVKALADGHKMKWREFDFTFRFFPGQTYYHGALLAKKKDERPIMFIGDAFSPSGMDDYCVLNRNLLHRDDGYRRCFRLLREIEEDYWLVNEHIQYVFSFSPREMDYLESRFEKRIEILRELFPWDDPNYGVDEQWSFFYPYANHVKPGQSTMVEVRIVNHSPKSREFSVTPHARGDVHVTGQDRRRITLKPGERGQIRIQVQAGKTAGPQLVTADVSSPGMEFRDWVETMIIVGEDRE